MSYSDKLKHDRWLALAHRLKFESGFVCNDCDHQFPEKKLEAHHCWYEYGREPWDYPDNCFMVLCKPCHKTRQKVQNSALVVLGMLARLLTVEELKILTMEMVAKRQDLEHDLEVEL